MTFEKTKILFFLLINPNGFLLGLFATHTYMVVFLQFFATDPHVLYNYNLSLCAPMHLLNFLILQWMTLNGITLGQTITDPFNRILLITKYMSYKRMLFRGIQDMINLGHFDPITQMIPLTVIPLSSAHCSSQIIHGNLILSQFLSIV